MKKRDIIRLLERLDLQPSRKLGQNFLFDPNLLQAIVTAARVSPGDRVLEIGPGTGVLTRGLLDRGADLTAIEYDARLAAWLRESMGAETGLRLVEADACRVDFDSLMGEAPYRCVANLPYSVSTVVLARLLACRNRPVSLTILLQREMAERLAAPPGCKAYGALTVRAQAVYRVKLERIVPPHVFLPPPEVDSALVTMTLDPEGCPPAAYKRLDTVVRLAFSQRRKRLRKVLRGGPWDDASIDAALASAGIDPALRPEAVTVAQFRRLADALPG